MSVIFLNNVSIYLYDKQECIPVGCVPPTSVAVSVGWGGGCYTGCVSGEHPKANTSPPPGRHLLPYCMLEYTAPAHCMLGYTRPL